VFGILNVIQIFISKGQMGYLAPTFFILGLYLLELSNSRILNDNPKYYFQGTSNITFNKNQENAIRKNKNYKSKQNDFKEQDTKKVLTTNEQRQSLEMLKEKGVLSESEFQDKIKVIKGKESEIRENELLSELKKTSEYENLVSLQQNEIINESELNAKIKILKDNFKNKKESDEKPVKLSKENLAAKWSEGNILFNFSSDYSFQYCYNKTSTAKPICGRWQIIDTNKICLEFNKKQEFLFVLYIREGKICYKHKKSIFKLNKVT